MAIDQSYYDAYKEIGFEKERNYSMLDWDHNGPNCLAMAIETVVFCTLGRFSNMRFRDVFTFSKQKLIFC